MPISRADAEAILLCGPSLAGKSTVCERIAVELHAAVICADAINAERGLPFGAEGLPESVWAETLRLQLDQVREHARSGRSLVVDDTLCYRWLRDRFRAAAAAVGLVPRLLVLMPSRDELLARHALLSRNGGRPLLSLRRLIEHLDAFEWPTQDEAAVDISTPALLDAWFRARSGDEPGRN